ncbi:MAG: toxin-antitoxin system YwqK family antitoxin [Pirellulales bacterium]|nr:toxin-antitoxin system YwqK family antitoxin [Pirellulales bacterium]
MNELQTTTEPVTPTLAKNGFDVPRLPIGPQWYLVLYRWFLVAAGIYTIWSTWNVWQVRSGPQFEFSPMLPVWGGIPPIDFGWALIGSLLLILVLPRTGMTILSAMLVLSVLCDQMRLQPHYQIVFLLWATLPGVNARFFGRMSLITIWFWVGFHKLLIDFIKPDGMVGFAGDIIPGDLIRFFPPDKYLWNTPLLGQGVGWLIGLTETSLAVMCVIPRTRWVAAVLALMMHSVILWWNCWQWGCNLIGLNTALALAGFALIAPWKEWPWVTWRHCNWPIRVGTILLLVYPALHYINLVNGYLAYCLYVPNSPFAILYRPGESPKFVPMMPVGAKDPKFDGRRREVNFPLPPSHAISQQWFDKIRKPGDVLIIHDPRPWAESRGLNGHQITDLGSFPRGVHWQQRYEKGGSLAAEGDTVDGVFRGLWISYHTNGKVAEQGVMIDGAKQGHWVRFHDNGAKAKEGNYDEGIEAGHWIFWDPDGKKAQEGSFKNGQPDGTWKSWDANGIEEVYKYRSGILLVPETEALP